MCSRFCNAQNAFNSQESCAASSFLSKDLEGGNLKKFLERQRSISRTTKYRNLRIQIRQFEIFKKAQ